jgi:hypothetical protein
MALPDAARSGRLWYLALAILTDSTYSPLAPLFRSNTVMPMTADAGSVVSKLDEHVYSSRFTSLCRPSHAAVSVTGVPKQQQPCA